MCRVYGDLLQLCWNLPRHEQTDAIKAFARKYGWDVEIDEPSNLGMVAVFTAQGENRSEVQNEVKEWDSEPDGASRRRPARDRDRVEAAK